MIGLKICSALVATQNLIKLNLVKFQKTVSSPSYSQGVTVHFRDISGIFIQGRSCGAGQSRSHTIFTLFQSISTHS
jgi:hypothetical protein